MADDHGNRERNRNIVNVSSLAGTTVFPGQGQAVYAASKAAVNQLSKHLAVEFGGFGIRVNALAPNSFARPGTAGGVITAAEAAAGIVALDTDTVTGKVLQVDAQPSAGAEPAA